MGLHDESDGCEDEDEALDWSRGDKVITDDGSITARRLARGKAVPAEAGGKSAKPGAHDDVVLELRGDMLSASFFCEAEPAAKAALAQLPLSRVLLALSRDESGLWDECTRGLAPGDTVCFRCAAAAHALAAGLVRVWARARVRVGIETTLTHLTMAPLSLALTMAAGVCRVLPAARPDSSARALLAWHRRAARTLTLSLTLTLNLNLTLALTLTLA